MNTINLQNASFSTDKELALYVIIHSSYKLWKTVKFVAHPVRTHWYLKLP